LITTTSNTACGCARAGFITHSPLLSAHAHDINHLGSLIEGFAGIVPANKGFLDEYQQALRLNLQDTQIITPVKSNMAIIALNHVKLVKQTKYRRQLVETVGSQLVERFQITKIKVKDLWHYQNRIFRKILSHPVGIFLNMQNGNKPLQLAQLADF